MSKRLIVREGIGGSVGETDRINAAGESLVVDVEDLDNIVAHAIQLTDNGTVTAELRHSANGTNFVKVGADITEASFPAGAGTVVERTLSDANGMSIRTKSVQLIIPSVYTGTGAYKLVVFGVQREGYR